MTSETYGFVPLSQLQKLSIASPAETCNFLLDVTDVHSCMKSAREQDAVVLTRQLNERVFLIINVGFVHEVKSYKVARKLAKDYRSYGLLPKVKSFKTILKNHKRQWLQDLQKITLIWQKSQVFADELKEQLSPNEESLLNERDLFLTCRLFLTASDAYQLCQKALPVLEQWQSALEYDYGCIEVSKVRHLESFNSPKNNYAILLNSTSLPTKPVTEQDFYQVSRRIIALASASLLNKGSKSFIVFADEILSKISSKNKDLELSLSYLKNVKAILENFYFNWKENWLDLKTDDSYREKIGQFLQQHELTEEILDNPDLSKVANKYFLTLNIKKPRRKRSVSFEGTSEEEEEEDSSSSLASPRTSSRPTSPTFGSPKAGNSPRTSLSPRIKGEELLQEWLSTHYPILLDNCLSQEFRGSLENFLKKNYETIYQDFKNNVTPALKESVDKLFDLYRDAVKNSVFSYLCFEYLLSTNIKVVEDFVQDKNYLSFLSFLFHQHRSYFEEFANNHTELPKNNLSSKSDIPSGPLRKQALYKLHVNSELKSFIIRIFLNFYHFNSEEEANSQFFQFCANLEIRNKQKRNQFLKLFNIIEQIANLSITKSLLIEEKFLFDCFEFFIKNKLFIVRDFLVESPKPYYNFLTFLIEKYTIELKLFLMEEHLPLLSEIVSKPLKKKKLSQSEMIIEEFSSQAFTRAKQYIIFLHRVNDEPLTFLVRFKEYLKTFRSSQKQFFITDQIASQLKKNDRVKIKNKHYEILDLSRSPLTCNLAIKYDPKIKDTVTRLPVDKIIERSQGSIVIKASLARKLQTLNVQQIQVGTNSFNVLSFTENRILTVVPIESKEDVQELQVGSKISETIPTIVGMIAALQSPELKSRTNMIKLLDSFREFAPDLFRR